MSIVFNPHEVGMISPPQKERIPTALDALREALRQQSPHVYAEPRRIMNISVIRADNGWVVVEGEQMHVCTRIEDIHNVVTRMLGAAALSET